MELRPLHLSLTSHWNLADPEERAQPWARQVPSLKKLPAEFSAVNGEQSALLEAGE